MIYFSVAGRIFFFPWGAQHYQFCPTVAVYGYGGTGEGASGDAACVKGKGAARVDGAAGQAGAGGDSGELAAGGGELHRAVREDEAAGGGFDYSGRRGYVQRTVIISILAKR